MYNKKNINAFTLIELLAVIAILAIIMIIAVPTVLNTIATAKKGAFRDSILSIIKDSETKLMEGYTLDTDIKLPLEGEYVTVNIEDLKFENKQNFSGYIIITRSDNNYNYFPFIRNNEYCITGVNKTNISTSDILDVTNCNLNIDLNNIYVNNNKITNSPSGILYKLKENNNINDDNGNSGGNTEEVVTEKIMTFDGKNNTIINDLQVNLTSNAKNTVEFWMNTNADNKMMPISFQYYNLYFYFDAFGFNTDNGELMGVAFPAALKNTWVHVTAVFHNGQINAINNKIYFNGQLQTLKQYVLTPKVRTVTTSMMIGNYITTPNYPYVGQLKNIRVWNVEIPQSQIIENMDKVITDAPNLVYSSDK